MSWYDTIFLRKPRAHFPPVASPPGVQLPAKALDDARTPAERLDALVVGMGASHYEKTQREDGVISIALLWTNGDRITGQGATPGAAVQHLVGRAQLLGGGA